MIYRIKNIFLLVENEISEYDEIIYGRFSQFNKKSNIKVDNYLKFKRLLNLSISSICHKSLLLRGSTCKRSNSYRLYKEKYLHIFYTQSLYRGFVLRKNSLFLP